MMLSHFLHSSTFPSDLTFATHSTPIPQGTNDVLRHRAVGVRFYVPSNRVSLSINGCFSRITTDSSFGRAEIQPAFIFDLKNILQSTRPVFYFTRPGAAYRSFFHNMIFFHGISTGKQKSPHQLRLHYLQDINSGGLGTQTSTRPTRSLYLRVFSR